MRHDIIEYAEISSVIGRTVKGVYYEYVYGTGI